MPYPRVCAARRSAGSGLAMGRPAGWLDDASRGDERRTDKRRVTSIASRVLPTPPAPVSVSSRRAPIKRWTSTSSRSRPTKVVSATGNWLRGSGRGEVAQSSAASGIARVLGARRAAARNSVRAALVRLSASASCWALKASTLCWRGVYRTEELTPRTWPDFERLFSRGNGWDFCWCMAFHRAPRPSRHVFRTRVEVSVQNQRAKRALLDEGHAHGILVYADDEPIGWCQYGTSDELLARMGAPQPEERGWRITCFVVDRRFRRKGVAGIALHAALASIRHQGGGLVAAFLSCAGRTAERAQPGRSTSQASARSDPRGEASTTCPSPASCRCLKRKASCQWRHAAAPLPAYATVAELAITS